MPFTRPFPNEQTNTDFLGRLTNVSSVYASDSQNYLPKLQVKDKEIIRSDNQKPILLKGMTSEAFRGRGFYPDQAIKHIDLLKSWGANIVNFYINPFALADNEANLKILDQIVDYADKNKIYISIQPVMGYESQDYFGWAVSDYDVQKAREFMDTIDKVNPILAQRYNGKNNVMLGIWTEPHPPSIIPEYEQRTKDIVSKMRQNTDAIIMKDISMDGEALLNDKNTVYHFNHYMDKNLQEHLEDRPLVKDIIPFKGLTETIKKVPVIFNEFGGFWDYQFGSFNSPKDVALTKDLINFSNKNNLHYIGYVLNDQHELNIADKEGIPNNKGIVFQDDLKNNPPTSFDTPIEKTIRKTQEMTGIKKLGKMIPNGYKPLTLQLAEKAISGAQKFTRDFPQLKGTFLNKLVSKIKETGMPESYGEQVKQTLLRGITAPVTEAIYNPKTGRVFPRSPLYHKPEDLLLSAALMFHGGVEPIGTNQALYQNIPPKTAEKIAERLVKEPKKSFLERLKKLFSKEQTQKPQLFEKYNEKLGAEADLKVFRTMSESDPLKSVLREKYKNDLRFSTLPEMTRYATYDPDEIISF